VRLPIPAWVKIERPCGGPHRSYVRPVEKPQADFLAYPPFTLRDEAVPGQERAGIVLGDRYALGSGEIGRDFGEVDLEAEGVGHLLR
jgi:hypothetical protein